MVEAAPIKSEVAPFTSLLQSSQSSAIVDGFDDRRDAPARVRTTVDSESIRAVMESLGKRTQEMILATEMEEVKGDEEGDACLIDPLQIRWAKEAISIVTQHLSEQQKISILSEQLTLLTYQPQEATGDDVNFKQELRQICDQLTFEVEQKELAVLAAPTRLSQKRTAVDNVFKKFRQELEQVEQGFKKPQMDRDYQEDDNQRQDALSVFTEGYHKFIEQNQCEIDDIENQQLVFREGKKELIESMRNLINDFKKTVRTRPMISLRQLFSKYYTLTPMRGLMDQTLVRGSQIWPQEKDFADLSPQDLRDVQLASIQYYKVGSILSMQMTLSNGMQSPFAGNSGVGKCDQSVNLLTNRPIRRIRIKASKNWVNEIRFSDEHDETIGEVKADSGVGDWFHCVLEKGERIVGFQAEHDQEQYVRRFGFVTFKS